MQSVTVAWFVNQIAVEIPPTSPLGSFIQEPLAASNRLEHYLQVCNKTLTTLVMHLLFFTHDFSCASTLTFCKKLRNSKTFRSLLLGLNQHVDEI